jgi:hypothetical protein
MHVEDSYEGALRRLQRLGHAGVTLAPPTATQAHADRIRDLEELATLACDENDQLKRELEEARSEIARLRDVVTNLRESLADDGDSFTSPKRNRGPAAFFVVMLLGGAGILAWQFRPWERFLHAPAAIAATTPTPAPTPVVTTPPPPAPTPVAIAPAPTPPVTPAVTVAPKVEPTIPKAPPTIPKAEPVVAAPAPGRHHASKHHAAKPAHHEKKHAARSSKKSDSDSSSTEDPLGGLSNL